MIRTIVAARGLVAMSVAAVVGTWGVLMHPVDPENPFLGLMALQNPSVFRVLTYGYATLWFTTTFFAASLGLSVMAIVAARAPDRRGRRPLPPYPDPTSRPEPSLVLGEAHLTRTSGPAPTPTWLTIPQRGLYTGVMILGAVGTGKTSACMYPYVDQLLRWRAGDPDRKLGGLVLEVKGDFCRQVQRMLQAAGREADYLEIGLNTAVCYNPLHNDLDPYAVAYAIGSLLNNLFGKSKEPFWQQAYTDLLKFVISLRRITDGYTTLAEVYRYIIDDELIRKNLQTLKNHFDHPPDVIAIGREWYQGQIRQTPWTLWAPLGDTHMGHPYEGELDAYLATHDMPFEVRTGSDAICADRRHRFEAIQRWFYNTWTRLDTKVKASIVEGVVVFLSLFDENPAVHRAFCPPRQAYITPPRPGEPRPLPPLEDLLETGHVLGLNFPVAMNPALARGLGVMLKLDFQRAVLQRIPKIAADPQRPWRDLLFVADEYHAFATVGETDPTGDERAFALSRQARLIPIVATQSISSLRSALASDEAWRTLLQCFRTKVFLATSDEFTARIAADLCGRADRLKARYTLSEGGQGAHISLLSGRATASKHSLSASKTYMLESDYLFQPRVFTELQHAQAIAVPYDGLNPLPPQYCYLKPYYLDVQTSYFDHVARGAL
ncbi:MAG TPA: type IV secretion system DNA-binding domain-containing protein [Gemmatimonadales bacterium]|nr:type IV secretion system DNA-binding domain-containing protein [Gemmatimonadales bacterium]